MGKILVVGIKDSSYHKVKFEFKNEYNLEDYNKIIELFNLLEDFGAPIKKSIEKYLSKYYPKEEKVFPI